MLIECSSCHARYRIKASMLKGFKGAQVRCRKCGGMIVVLTPGSDSGTPKPGARVERRAHSRHPFPATGKAGRSFGDEMVPPVPAAQGLQRMEAQAGMEPTEETGSVESVPDNVFQLDLFRGVPPEESPTETSDISGQIRTDPVVPPAREKPAGETTRAAAEPPKRREPDGASLPGETIAWENEGVTLMSDEGSLPFPGEPENPEKSSARSPRFRSGYSFSVAPRPSHVAIVYLLLLLLGGCGYLLVRFLAKVAGGGV